MKTKFYLRKGSGKSTIQFEFRNGKNSRFRQSTNFVINSDNVNSSDIDHPIPI